MNPSTVHAALVIAAKKMVAEHWPNAAGSCPICRVPDCAALRSAVEYLEEHSDRAERLAAALRLRELPELSPGQLREVDAALARAGLTPIGCTVPDRGRTSA
jgi:hypothetical protein